MRYAQLTGSLLALAAYTQAASSCKRDSCYNNVAIQNSAPFSVRRADCNALFRGYIVDVTRTLTSLVTVFPSTSTFTEVGTTIVQTTSTTSPTTTVTTLEITTSTTSTQTIYTFSTNPLSTTMFSSSVERRTVATAVAELENPELEARDKLVVQGNRPKYVTACRNVQEYATACACWNARGSVLSTSIRTNTQIVTLSRTASATDTISETTQTTDVLISAVQTTSTTSTETDTVVPQVTTQSILADPVATQISKLRVVGTSRYVTNGGLPSLLTLTNDITNAIDFGVILAGGRPFLARNYDVKLNAINDGDYSNLGPSDGISTNPGAPLICSVGATDGIMSCRETEAGRTIILNCEPGGGNGGGGIFIVSPGSFLFAQCDIIQLELASYNPPSRR